jgi:leader peptidase (prepilin peptidase)/N-methyltransferase
MTIAELRQLLPTWFIVAAVTGFGLLWGSFLNVVIYRVPLELSVVRPASHCPACGEPIAPYDNVPVLSYLLLRGRARCCGARMSPRYPLVELIGGGLSLAILVGPIGALAPSTDVGVAAALYAAYFALCLGLVAAAFIDVEHMFLPDSITLGGVVLGVATSWLRQGARVTDLAPWLESATGAAIGFFVVWFPLIFLYRGLRGLTGMGIGDAKLVALAGAWFGWPGAVFALFAGALQGSLYALALRVLGIPLRLPKAVLADLEELRKAAAEGDEEAKKELAGDPLAEDFDPFLVRGLGRAWRWFSRTVLKRDVAEPRRDAGASAEPRAEADAGPASAEAPLTDAEALEELAERGHLPFGPFLILACLELLFLHDWIASRLAIFSLDP